MNPLIVILGPTASGKTHLANQVAARLDGEILSVDSRQVYRRMDIGTGKDLQEYIVDGKQIPFHLIDILDAGEKYNVSLFQSDFEKAYEDISGRNKTPIACGGTGFYLLALLKGHQYTDIPVGEKLRSVLESLSNEQLLERFNQSESSYRELADTSTRKRLIRAIEITEYLDQNPQMELSLSQEKKTEYNPIVFGLDPPTDIRRERISKRLSYRLEHGLIQEVEKLMESGITADDLIYYGLEYKFVTQYLLGELSMAEMKKRLETEIHRFAKRQMTFFRKMEKDGIEINWLNFDNDEDQNINEIITHYRNFVNNK